MRRAEAIARLKESEPALRERGVRALYLFGSVSRDEAQEHSDIDILVDLDPVPASGLRGYMAPLLLLEEQFPGIEVGYGTRDAISPVFRKTIEKSAIRIF